MSADEAASWAAAAAPNLIEVVHRQQRLNPGKLAVHDVAMHLWMRLFGDSLASLRGLSALFGTVSILLVFLVVCETFAGDANTRAHDVATAPPESDREWFGAVSALLFAVTFKMVLQSREIRMYSVMVAMVLAQIWFFMRVNRRSGSLNYVGLAVFTALAVGSHFAAALIVLAECLWLTPRLYRRWMLPDASRDDRSWKIVATFVLTALAMLPFARAALGIGYGFVKAGSLGWISRPPLTAPVALFADGMGDDSAFMLCAVAALWGVARAWRVAPRVLSFLLLWMLVPPLAMLLISYVAIPVFTYRYALSSLVPFLVLAAIGIDQLRSGGARSLALVAVTAACGVALLPVFGAHPPVRKVEWSEAATATAAGLKPAEYAIVEPDWTADVVRYYLRMDPEARVIGANLESLRRSESEPALLVISDRADLDDPAGTKFLLWAAPEVIAKFEGVSVRRIAADRIATLRR